MELLAGYSEQESRWLSFSLALLVLRSPSTSVLSSSQNHTRRNRFVQDGALDPTGLVLFQPKLQDASSTWVSGIPPQQDGMPRFSALFDGSLLQPVLLLVAHRIPGAWSCLPY